MIIIWGARLYGKVDEVPGMFHVATKFGHVWYIPIIPMGSHIVLEQTGQGWRGVPVSLSGKSIMVAWLRGVGIAGMVFSAIGILVTAVDPRGVYGPLMTAAAIFAVALGVTIYAFASKGLRHASYERAVALGDKLGLSDEGRILLEMKFNRITPEQAKSALEEAARDRQEIAKLAAERTTAEIPVSGSNA
jgi:hypothetical protein